MAIKFDKVTPGMRLCDVRRYKMGNTRMSALGLWHVDIVSVDATGAMVRWNGNPVEWWGRQRIQRLYLKPPPAYVRQQESKTWW
jgi:hypothetical protein